MDDDLINGLLSLSLKVSVMEKELGMPLNSLSSILKKTKPFPPKWIRPVQDYLSRKNSAVSCVMGCKVFTGGEIRHHPDCPFYPESFSRVYDETVEKLKECENKAIPAHQTEKAAETTQKSKEAPQAPVKPFPDSLDDVKPDGVTKEPEMYMGVLVPSELSGVPLAVWRNNIKVKAKQAKKEAK